MEKVSIARKRKFHSVKCLVLLLFFFFFSSFVRGMKGDNAKGAELLLSLPLTLDVKSNSLILITILYCLILPLSPHFYLLSLNFRNCNQRPRNFCGTRAKNSRESSVVVMPAMFPNRLRCLAVSLCLFGCESNETMRVDATVRQSP